MHMPFLSLWLPVVVSAVAVFAASAIIHMLLGYHAADMKALPGDDDVRTAMAKHAPRPGQYITPYCAGPKEMNQPEMQEKYAKGPVAIVTVLKNGVPKMGKYLGLWFLLNLLVSFTAAYVARHTLQPGADGLQVMRITGTVAFAAYGISHLSDSIWGGKPWGNTLRALFDAVIFAVITGLVFRWLFPAA